MPFSRTLLHFIAVAGLLTTAHLALGQAEYTSSRTLGLSSFSALTSRNSGFSSSRTTQYLNALDMTVGPKFGLVPTIEIRLYRRIDENVAVSSNTGLGGLALSKGWGATRLYGDALVGRSQLYYGNGGMRKPGTHTLYDASASNVLGLGGGIDRRLSERLHLRLDAQVETFKVPVRESRLYSIPVAFGLAFHLPCMKDGHPY